MKKEVEIRDVEIRKKRISPSKEEVYEEARVYCYRAALVSEELEPPKRRQLGTLIRRALRLIASKQAVLLVLDVIQKIVRILRE